MFELVYSAFLFFMFIQGLLNIYFSIYSWEDPRRLDLIKSPDIFLLPKKTFSILVPARHEEDVIGRTITKLVQLNYPNCLYEIIAICEANDIKTINVINQVIAQKRIDNVKLLTFTDSPINKPHGLNKGLAAAQYEIVTIIDAEDEINQEYLNIANTLYLEKKPDIIQAGVQLMNFETKWFSVHNVLEYYFWFKSRMHFHTKLGMVPLGGNSVFFKTSQLKNVGGWDDHCLTEDADIGIRLSVHGAKILSTYDSRHITKEETPNSTIQFIKQRTRWNQGFIQVLFKWEWLKYPGIMKKILCLYTLSFPIIQSLLMFITPLMIIIGLSIKASIVLSMISFIPILLLLAQFCINTLGLREFTIEQQIPLKFWIIPLMLLSLIPYQIILGIAAIRALLRLVFRSNNWEKTKHQGLHRQELIPQFEFAK